MTKVDLSGDRGIVGRHLLYAYDNGWRYELYVRNERAIDYRIHSGIVGGRWVRNQPVQLVQLADRIFKVSWTEPTGTSVSLAVDLGARRLHGVIFFPQWVHAEPARTICFQNDHLDEMARYRDAGPTYPIVVVDEFAQIHFVEDRGPDDESVIACPPSDCPPASTTAPTDPCRSSPPQTASTWRTTNGGSTAAATVPPSCSSTGSSPTAA